MLVSIPEGQEGIIKLESKSCSDKIGFRRVGPGSGSGELDEGGEVLGGTIRVGYMNNRGRVADAVRDSGRRGVNNAFKTETVTEAGEMVSAEAEVLDLGIVEKRVGQKLAEKVPELRWSVRKLGRNSSQQAVLRGKRTRGLGRATLPSWETAIGAVVISWKEGVELDNWARARRI